MWVTPLWPTGWSVIIDPQLRAGFAALCILVLLAVTSFRAPVRLLRITLWKPLHRLMYLAAALAVLHLALSPMADPRWIIASAAMLIPGALGRLAPARRR